MDLDDDYLDQLAHDCLRQAYHAAAAAVKEVRAPSHRLPIIIICIIIIIVIIKEHWSKI